MGRWPRAAASAGRLLGHRGAPHFWAPWSMCLVIAVVLVMLQERVDALDCGLGEYPIGAECCPMCAPGSRVFKHCTAMSSTTCVPCVGNTYMDHPNGLKHCKSCKLCDKEANLVAEVACTYTKNTVCGCLPGFFCSFSGAEDCELCQRYTVCFPDSMIKEKGTNTTDNVCEACPPGTFSTASMPYSCTQPRLQEDSCVQCTHSTIAAIVCPLVFVLVATAVFTCIFQRMRRKSYVPPVQELGSEQQGQVLMLPVENEDQTMLPVQETNADPKESGPEQPVCEALCEARWTDADLSPGGSVGEGKDSFSSHSGKHRTHSAFSNAMKRPAPGNKNLHDIAKQTRSRPGLPFFW